MSRFARLAALALVAAAVTATAPAHAEWVYGGFVANGADGVSGMLRASDVAVTPDGRHVYVAGRAEHAIAIFARDGVTGALAFAGKVAGTTATPPGAIPNLRAPGALALSPDGRHLYAAGGNGTDSGVVCFARDADTGALTWIGSVLDNAGSGLFYLDVPNDVLVSADGTVVYVAAFDARAITVLARDADTGLLAHRQTVLDDANGVDGLEGLQSVAESPDGAYLYAASKSRTATVPGLGGVATFARAADGTLTFLDLDQQNANGVDGLWAPTDVAASADGRHVYAAAHGLEPPYGEQPGSLAIFERQLDGTLALADVVLDAEIGVAGIRRVALSPDGAAVFLLAYGALNVLQGSLAVLARDADTGLVSLAQLFQDGVDGTDGLAGPLGLALAPDGAQVYVASEQDPQGDPLRGGVALFAQAPEPDAALAAGLAVAALGAVAQRRGSRARSCARNRPSLCALRSRSGSPVSR